ncbi:non-ribosomal peptide synthetase [Vibrio sp. AND4]|uniref:non-ribosomal peptide synthetase n=1 Tax=Vibrio sp. AND4 TaxID=314289 RepID=UPI00015EFBD6|nr:non-ribosomal peptide synthetase [Vibrio sp. AND4]EDP60191.1 yersiniabactin biosynthetic protein [Vibrio sp. AND4]
MTHNEPSPSHHKIALPLTSNQSWLLSTQRQRSEQRSIANFIYQEFDYSNTSWETLKHCLDALISRHPMLTATISDDFFLQITKKTPIDTFNVNDLIGASEEEIQRVLSLTRTELTTSQSPATVCLVANLLAPDTIRLHARFNSVIVDMPSVALFFEQLGQMLHGNHQAPASEEQASTSHQQLINGERANVSSSSSADRVEHLLNLPSSANIPTACEPEKLIETGITRRTLALSLDKWQQLTIRSKKYEVTPELTLASVFAAVLSLWGQQKETMLRFDRHQDQHQADVMGQFTQPLLVGLSGVSESFVTLVKENQANFDQVQPYPTMPIFPLIQQLIKLSDSHRYPANIAFSSQLSTINQSAVWGCQQSANTWLSLHATITHDGLELLWDSQDALFPENLIADMLSCFSKLLNHLCQADSHWLQPLPVSLPETQASVRHTINSQGSKTLPEGLLHHGFWKNADRFPDATAIIHGQSSLNYQTLADHAERCAGALAKAGVVPGDRVAISMDKGIGQVVAALGILYAGAIYVPVSLDQPRERREGIYQGAEINVVLTDQSYLTGATSTERFTYLIWQDAIKSSPMDKSPEVSPEQPAYIIYTSGSTGTPKGVVISHQGALNTCIALNQRYQVDRRHRMLALSALHFDLSVYDIFGLLSAGGAVVLVDESDRRDPSAWCKAIKDHKVTMWNSVPALFDMLLTYSSCFNNDAPSRIQLAMLSGDWIGVDLPARYRQYRADGKFIAMGGATEASIWSNVFDVEQVPDNWVSIPYGYPLSRQKYRVVDNLGRDCPDWVPGELWIGGDGVALGYFNDEQKTQTQFVTQDDQTWYRTGDMGCYWPNGVIEFLGRRDRQVKIGGYRIELGEIEAALNSIPQVQRSVATATGKKDKTLVAFIVTDSEQTTVKPLDTDDIQDHLKDQLPTYMIPQRIVLLDALPLTANGKIDHTALAQIISRKKKRGSGAEKPLLTTSEHKLAELWSEIIGRQSFHKLSDFFQSGGDAYHAIELVQRLHQSGYPLKLSVVYRYPTLEALALIMERCQLATGQGV